MRRVLSGVSRSVAVLAVLVGGAGRAGAGPLNPGDFTPVGPFPTAGGDIHVQHHRAESHPERDGQDDFDWRRLKWHRGVRLQFDYRGQRPDVRR